MYKNIYELVRNRKIVLSAEAAMELADEAMDDVPEEVEGEVTKIQTIDILAQVMNKFDTYMNDTELNFSFFINNGRIDKAVNFNTLEDLHTLLNKTFDEKEFVSEKIETSFGTYEISSLFMGTTHTVTFSDNLQEENIEGVGKEIENNPIFPVKTNVNFVEVKTRAEVDVNTWERGAGFTYACGTGCCASVVMAKRFGYVDNIVKVNVPGGHMYIELEGDSVYMIGPSEKICFGEY